MGITLLAVLQAIAVLLRRLNRVSRGRRGMASPAHPVPMACCSAAEAQMSKYTSVARRPHTVQYRSRAVKASSSATSQS